MIMTSFYKTTKLVPDTLNTDMFYSLHKSNSSSMFLICKHALAQPVLLNFKIFQKSVVMADIITHFYKEGEGKKPQHDIRRKH